MSRRSVCLLPIPSPCHVFFLSSTTSAFFMTDTRNNPPQNERTSCRKSVDEFFLTENCVIPSFVTGQSFLPVRIFVSRCICSIRCCERIQRHIPAFFPFLFSIPFIHPCVPCLVVRRLLYNPHSTNTIIIVSKDSPKQVGQEHLYIGTQTHWPSSSRPYLLDSAL